MKYIKILLICIFMITLTSCSDYIEPDEIAYTVGIGIDKGTNDSVYDYTIQFARPSKITDSESEEKSKSDEAEGTVNITAPSLYSALNLANHIVSKKFTLSHTKIIVISEEIAKEGFEKILNSISRNSDIRPNVYICVSSCKASKYLNSVEPIIEQNPEKYYRLIFDNKFSSFIPSSRTYEAYFNFENDTKENVLPLVGVAKSSKSENDKKDEQKSSQEDKKSEKIPTNYQGLDYDMKKYLAGELDIENESESESIGGAVFKGKREVGKIYGIETQIYNILNGSFTTGFSQVLINPEKKESTVTIRLEQVQKPYIKVYTNEEIPTIYTKIYLEEDLINTPSYANIENNTKSFEELTKKYLKQSIEKFLLRTQKEFDSDIIGYCQFSKKNFLNTYDFYKYDFPSKYKKAKFIVDVDVKLKQTGLTIQREGT